MAHWYHHCGWGVGRWGAECWYRHRSRWVRLWDVAHRYRHRGRDVKQWGFAHCDRHRGRSVGRWGAERWYRHRDRGVRRWGAGRWYRHRGRGVGHGWRSWCRNCGVPDVSGHRSSVAILRRWIDCCARVVSANMDTKAGWPPICSSRPSSDPWRAHRWTSCRPVPGEVDMGTVVPSYPERVFVGLQVIECPRGGHCGN